MSCLMLLAVWRKHGSAGAGGQPNQKDPGFLLSEFRNTGLILAEALVGTGQLLHIHAMHTHIQGLASRITGLIDTLKDLAGEDEEGQAREEIQNADQSAAVLLENADTTALGQPLQLRNTEVDSDEACADSITFLDADVATPTGNVLVRGLNFRIARKTVLLTGHNGAGKSSIFRAMAGLWRLTAGKVVVKHDTQNKINAKNASGSTTGSFSGKGGGRQIGIFYLPQKPYNVHGTLREQIFYPLKGQKVDSRRLLAYLRRVGLGHLLLQHQETSITTGGAGGDLARQQSEGDTDSNKSLESVLDRELDRVRDWDKVLSLGEKQRLAIARLWYHRPNIAVLDECTSAVSVDLEELLYEECQRLGIVYVTVCHRPALKKFHDFSLRLDGRGGYSWTAIDEAEKAAVQTKREALALERENTVSLESDQAVQDIILEDADVDEANKKGSKPPAGSSVVKGRTTSTEELHQDQEAATSSTSTGKTSGHSGGLLRAARLFQSGFPGNEATLLKLAALTACRTLQWESWALLQQRTATALVDGDRAKLPFLLLSGALQALLMSLIDEESDFTQRALCRGLNASLTRKFLKSYLAQNRFYNLQHFSCIGDADVRGTVELMELCSGFGSLFTTLLSPLLDIFWFSARLFFFPALLRFLTEYTLRYQKISEVRVSGGGGSGGGGSGGGSEALRVQTTSALSSTLARAAQWLLSVASSAGIVATQSPTSLSGQHSQARQSFASGRSAALLLGYNLVTSFLLRQLLRHVHEFTRSEKSFNSRFRELHYKAQAHAESIAFFRGGPREKQLADAEFGHLRQLLSDKNLADSRYRLWYSFLVHDPADYAQGQVCVSDLLQLYLQRGLSAGANSYADASVRRILAAFGSLTTLQQSLTALAANADRVGELFEELSAPGGARSAQNRLSSHVNGAAEISALYYNGASTGSAGGGSDLSSEMEEAGGIFNICDVDARSTTASSSKSSPRRRLPMSGSPSRVVLGRTHVVHLGTTAAANQHQISTGSPTRRGANRAISTTGLNVEAGEEGLTFHNVDLVTPRGLTLACDISLSTTGGLMITGPNASGKTALFRVLCGLWPIQGAGWIRRPRQMQLVPQAVYMVLGTLAEQVSYPDRCPRGESGAGTQNSQILVSDGSTRQHFSQRTDTTRNASTNKNHPSNILLKEQQERQGYFLCVSRALEKVDLQYLETREGFFRVRPWENVLSLGEQQRVCFARVFYQQEKVKLFPQDQFGHIRQNEDCRTSTRSRRALLKIVLALLFWTIARPPLP
ncbi:unnamed protein product [Amoebophrya sp. A25]|nr:unnamed protein product [Amoebophrya sp. A25]|eukprot:GSA25T00027020001.1